MKTPTFLLMTMIAASSFCDTAPVNIARGKNYTFSAPPNYGLCTDKDDVTQLTDGAFVSSCESGFWTSKATVGWTLHGVGDRMVTVDLGEDEPLTGFSWNFAAGRAGVSWPDLIFVYVSSDGRTWRFAGDLYGHSKDENGAPKQDGYGVYRARSVKMPSHGRYVRFLIRASGYAFVDEIEVYRGVPSFMTAGDDATPISDPLKHYAEYRGFRNFFTDAVRIGRAAELLDASDRQKVTEGLNRLNALVMRGMGYTRPFLWACDRWASADAMDLPQGKSVVEASLTVEMMRGETRSEAVNLSNPTDCDLKVEIAAEGFPAEANVRLREVVPTIVKSGVRVGGCLMGAGTTSLSLSVAAGTTRQVWISFDKPTCAAGTYVGRIVAGDTTKPLTLRLAALDFPKRPRLHVGGWDYTERGGRQFGSVSNLLARLARMGEFFTDSPWAAAGVMPSGAKFDKTGALLNAGSLNFAVWNDWVGLWGDQARQYCVFANVRDNFHGEKMGTERFNRMVGSYMRAWYDGIKAKLAGRRVVLLLVDEPFTAEQDAVIIAWAKAVKAAAPEFVIFEDTDRSSPRLAVRTLYDVCDIVCPPLPEVTAKGTHDFFIRQRREKGKEIWFYSCCGPSRTLDPIVYYRAQAWNAWKCGAKGSMFWAFGCGGGIGDSFRPFEQRGTEYSPFFVSPTDAFRAKQSEAILEGVEDYEYLAMLTDSAVALKRAGRDVSALGKLIAEAPDRVLPREDWLKRNQYSFGVGANRYDWFAPRDRGAMDRVRVEILRALERVASAR